MWLGEDIVQHVQVNHIEKQLHEVVKKESILIR